MMTRKSMMKRRCKLGSYSSFVVVILFKMQPMKSWQVMRSRPRRVESLRRSQAVPPSSVLFVNALLKHFAVVCVPNMFIQATEGPFRQYRRSLTENDLTLRALKGTSLFGHRARVTFFNAGCMRQNMRQSERQSERQSDKPGRPQAPEKRSADVKT